MLCAQFKPILHHFYDIVNLWTIDWVSSLDKHMQICVPLNVGLICGLVLIFLCGLLSVSDDTTIHNCFRQKSVYLSLPKIFLPLIQLLLLQNGLVKTSSGPKFDYG